MAFTTHPNQLDTRRGLRVGMIVLAFVALFAVATLGYSVVVDDSETAPAAVDFPTVDEMRAENMEIRRQIAVAHTAGEAPSSGDVTNDEDPVIRPTKELP